MTIRRDANSYEFSDFTFFFSFPAFFSGSVWKPKAAKVLRTNWFFYRTKHINHNWSDIHLVGIMIHHVEFQWSDFNYCPFNSRKLINITSNTWCKACINCLVLLPSHHFLLLFPFNIKKQGNGRTHKHTHAQCEREKKLIFTMYCFQ